MAATKVVSFGKVLLMRDANTEKIVKLRQHLSLLILPHCLHCFRQHTFLSWFWLLISSNLKKKIIACKKHLIMMDSISRKLFQFRFVSFLVSILCSQMNLLCLCNFATLTEQCSSLVSLAVAFARQVEVIKTSKVTPSWCSLNFFPNTTCIFFVCA